MCLVQDSQVLFLDEPTTYLDLSHQFEIMELTRQLKQAGKTVIMVLHDLGLALSYADQLAVMQSGRLVFAGSPQKVLESGCLEQVFRVRIQKGGLQKSGGIPVFSGRAKGGKRWRNLNITCIREAFGCGAAIRQGPVPRWRRRPPPAACCSDNCSDPI